MGRRILRERGTRVPSNTRLDKLLKKSNKTRQDICTLYKDNDREPDELILIDMVKNWDQKMSIVLVDLKKVW